MSDDWASDNEEGFGDFSVPEVKVPDLPPKPVVAPSPPKNAWAAPASGDARLATRLRNQASQNRPILRSPLSQDPRANSAPRSAGPPAPGFGSPRHPSKPFAAAHSSNTTTLYVSHLPSNVHEEEIVSFFSKCGVTRNDVRLSRHQDSGNVKAAFVTTRGDANRNAALAMNSIKLHGRPVLVKVDGATSPAPALTSPRQQPVNSVTSPTGPTTTLYVAHLPFNTHEGEIASFFEKSGVTPADVRLTRYDDTGKIKAAFVTTRGDANRDSALAMDGAKLAGLSVHVKIDGADRRGGGGSRERGGYGFGSRDRRTDDPHSGGGGGSHRETGWSSGGWVDRSGTGGFDSGGRGERGREARSSGGGRGGPGAARSTLDHRDDPTIPTGPPPAGRKKLVLKPRTKPPPVLDVDTRTLGSAKPSTPSSVELDAKKPETPNKFETRQHSGPRSTKATLSQGEKWTNSKDSAKLEGELWSTPKDGAPRSQIERWSNAKDGVPSRVSGQNQSANKKEDDSKRPVLLNTFAALEVNDTDV